MDEKDIEKKLLEVWNQQHEEQSKELKETSWQAFSSETFPRRKKNRTIWWGAAAAMLVLASAIGFNLTSSEKKETANYAYTIIENPTKQLKLVHLPDSSVVEMNSGARMEYYTDFTKKRDISLNGTAFFKVHKDKEHPFRVTSGVATTTVLGTSFTVICDNQNNIQVDLYEGSVKMNVKGNANNWILSPGEQFIYNNKSIDVQAFNRFKDFDNVMFTSVIGYIKINYGYSVIMPAEFRNKNITLRVNKKEELSNVVSLIADMYNLKPEINDKLKEITFK